LIGHILGGWGFSGNYIVASGQRYTPIQATAIAAVLDNALCTKPSGSCDYYDLGYILNFAGTDTARPFLGNLSAPSTAVGIFGADACNFFGAGCDVAPDQLISMNQLNVDGTSKTVTKDQVRFIINATEAQSIFGTPFGNTPRNPVQDAITTIGNASIYKNVKLGEHVNFEFHTSFLNVFNQANFSSVDPILEDAGLTGAFTGFGDPTQTPSVTTAAPPARRIIFGGKLNF
jgi:hypothetical protein